jgi:predicted ATP-dependent endonuclease of OLD family
MFIESILPANYGPFAFSTTLVLEKDVTVLTGPNDAGKSSMLHLLARCLDFDADAAGQQEFNSDNEHEAAEAWNTRDDFGSVITFRLTDDDNAKSGWPPPGWPVVAAKAVAFRARFNIAPQRRGREVTELINSDHSATRGPWPFAQKKFKVVVLPPQDEIRDTIPYGSPNQVELNLFRLALGAAFTFQKLGSSSPMQVERQLGLAENSLNHQAKKGMPSSLGIAWKLRSAADGKGVHCYLTDAHGAYTPLGTRGSGIRRVMSVLANLLSHDFREGHSIVLFDEPETSLHADSQHLLRRLLEDIAAMPRVQVVYATHSPSMINVMRPNSIRLFQRTVKEEKATTVIENQAFRENYYPVRASLGLTPADSLLYAPVTIIVEGETELLNLASLILKLAAARVAGFEDAEIVLAQTHILDGMGDRFGHLCRLARSQGATPVIFLDGDKRKHLPKFKVDGECVVILDDEDEFEQLIPGSVYFQALADAIGGEGEQINEEAYRQWEASAELPSRMAFSKRVGRWLDSLDVAEPRKARVMSRAIELVSPSQVKADRLRELLGHIRRLLPPS